MEEVLPSAMKTSRQHQQSMGDLGNLLLSLKTTMRRCVSGAQHWVGCEGDELSAAARHGQSQSSSRWGAGAGFPQERVLGWCRGAGRPRRDGVSPSPCSPGFHRFNNKEAEAVQGHHLHAATPAQQSLAEEIRGGRAEVCPLPGCQRSVAL